MDVDAIASSEHESREHCFPPIHTIHELRRPPPILPPACPKTVKITGRTCV